jgi:hypothetical protein
MLQNNGKQQQQHGRSNNTIGNEENELIGRMSVLPIDSRNSSSMSYALNKASLQGRNNNI